MWSVLAPVCPTAWTTPLLGRGGDGPAAVVGPDVRRRAARWTALQGRPVRLRAGTDAGRPAPDVFCRPRRCWRGGGTCVRRALALRPGHKPGRVLWPAPDARAVVQPQPAALRLALGHLHPRAPPDPLHPFVVHRPASRRQQRRHPATAVPLGQRDGVLGRRPFVVRLARHLAPRRPVLAKHAAHPPPGHVRHPSHLGDAAPAPRGARQFPFAAACRMGLSRAGSEGRATTAGMSFSRSFIRRAWSAPRPPRPFPPPAVGPLTGRDPPARPGGRAAPARHDPARAQLPDDPLGLLRGRSPSLP